MSKKPKTEAPKEPLPKYKRLSPKEWAELEVLYASGDQTLAQLAKKSGKSISSITEHMSKAGIKKGSAIEHKKAVTAAVTNAAIEDATVLAGRIRETKEEHYKMASGLAKLTWSEILKAKQDGLPFSAVLGNLKSLDAAMSVLKKAREERYAVLGLDRDDFVSADDVPELVISELTAEQIAELQQKSFAVESDELEGLPLSEDDEVVEETDGDE